MIRSDASDFSLLPKDATFRELLLPFVLPYLAYVALGGLLPGLLGPDLAQAVRFVIVAGLLLRFRRHYAFGPRLTPVQGLLALAAAVVATALWVGSLRLALHLPAWQDDLARARATEFSLLYALLRSLNSVLLTPLFEELFVRAYAMEAALPAGPGQQGEGLMERKPRSLPLPPLVARSILAATVIFALGHDAASIGPAVIYFLLTTAFYAWTRNFKAVILVHALTNAALAVLVQLRPDMRFLWF
jgi:membrane protease YdiL (CAAX protease family)